MQTESGNTGKCDELFLQRYDAAFKWALHIAKRDHQLAEDLVHNFYLQFKKIFRDGKTVNIASFDNYMYVSMRNLYVSHLRKSNRQREREFSIIDDFLLADDMDGRMKVRDKLFAVCHYACLRKDTSISSSILILRYFHGYFPSEVARILKSSRNVVEARLASARREAIVYLKNCKDFDIAEGKFLNEYHPNNYIHNQQDILQHLHRIIFNSTPGDCLDKHHIKKICLENKARLTRSELSHIVSCRQCLDEVNRLHGLMLLEQRHPLQTIGRENCGETEKNRKYFRPRRQCINYNGSKLSVKTEKR